MQTLQRPDLSRILQDLGGSAHAEPREPTDDLPLAEIGRLGALPVWTTSATAHFPVDLRRLARRGQLGLLLAQAEPSGRLLLGISLAPGRSLAHPAPALPLLARRVAAALARAQATPLSQGMALADAIDLDATGRRTFRMLHALLRDGVDQMPGTAAVDDRHAWVLTQLTRLLFLRFVEREGWLAQDPAFLRTQFERTLARRRDPLRHLLHPLFFGTLNRPRTQRGRAGQLFGAIPYLNGGLFEPHPVERRITQPPPREWWCEVFSALTERIDVTLDAEAADGAVTPEMLGRVFEGVMAPDERKAHGTYYTPPHLVDRLLRAALVPVLAARLGRDPDRVADGLLTPDPALQQACRQLRVLDPAVGSGAFLVGALHLLHGPGPRDPSRTRHLLTRCLYGIDRDPRAVRLTELRLWLELLRAQRGRPIARVPPLPNLDTMIRTGDALLDPLVGPPLPRQTRLLAELQSQVLRAHGPARRQAARSLRQAESSALRQGVTDQRDQYHRRRAALLREANPPALFAGPPLPDPTRDRAVLALDQAIARADQELRQITRGEGTPPFSPVLAFAPVLSGQGGFDLVVGNPPWARGDRLPAPMRDALRLRWSWWRRGGGRGFQQHPDVAVAFVERSIQLCRPGGVIALLVPVKLSTTDYATRMREALARQLTLLQVADLTNDAAARFEATTYPMALVVRHCPPSPRHQVALDLHHPATSRTPQAKWQGGGPWLLCAPDARALSARLESRCASIGDLLTPRLGLKTGANSVFLNPPDAVSPWTRPALRGRDLIRRVPAPSARLLWPASAEGVAWHRLPAAVARYLAPHRHRLMARADLQDGPWWRLFRTASAVAAHRVVWSDVARTLRATVLEDPDTIPLNSCYVAVLPTRATAHAFAAWCNSTWLRTLATLSADPAAQGYHRFNARTIARLPWHPAALDRLAHCGAYPPGGTEEQSLLDHTVADLLELSAADRALLSAVAAPRR